MAGGMGRPGANIGAGLPQARGQVAQEGAPQGAPQNVPQDAPMPVFNAPAISPMQQYMQSIGINRAPYNSGKFYNAGSQGYAAWRAPQNFQPQLTPQQTAASAAAAKPQQSELDKLRAELEDMRARQYGSYNNTGGGGGN